MKIMAIVVTIIVIDLLLMTIYCSFKDQYDKRRRIKKTQRKMQQSNTVEYQKTNAVGKINQKILHVYNYLDHYFYGLMRYQIIIVGKIPSYRIRRILYKHVFRMKLTKRSVIFGGCEFRSPWNIHMDNCVISANCILDGRNEIFIDENVVFGANVHVWTEEHDLNDRFFGISEKNAQPVYFGARTWICSDSTILPGITIGEGAVVAARACVTKDCEPFGVYGGVPAKKLRERNQDLAYELSGKPHWHFY